MTPDQITGIIRAVLAAAGGFVLSKGWVSSETWTWIGGGVITLGMTGWSLWTNRPAGLAGSTQALHGVNVTTSSVASSAVKQAVSDTKTKT